jgi:heme/copper-type cytochrome/quinol oxidase subunit 2
LIVTIAAVVALMKFFEKRKKTSEKKIESLPPSLLFLILFLFLILTLQNIYKYYVRRNMKYLRPFKKYA